MLALAHALGNADVEGALRELRPSVRAQLGVLQLEVTCRTLVGVLDIYQNPGIGIFSTRMEIATSLSLMAAESPTTKQALKKSLN